MASNTAAKETKLIEIISRELVAERLPSVYSALTKSKRMQI